jgi:hypothetical protein
VTTTISGNVVTSTQFGVQVAAVTGDAASGAGTAVIAGSTGAAAPMRTAGAGVAVGAAIMGLAAAL